MEIAHQMSGATSRTHSVRSQPWSLYNNRQRAVFLGILFFVTTSSYFDYYILSVVIEPLEQEFHVSDTTLGLLSGFGFALVYASTALPFARWADRGNRPTLIYLALGAWSVVTALCGLAQSFWQLALARLGVGLVEPGAVPPAQSLVADYFPPERRATASAVLIAGSSAGYLIGVGVGGCIAATFGRRAAFVFVGAPGVLLAVTAWLILPEPRAIIGFASVRPKSESIALVFLRLTQKRSFLYSLIGIATYTIFAYGVGGLFIPSFMIRTLHASLTQVSLTWGVAISVANLLGAVVGGWSADRLRRTDIRWYVWLPAIACALGAPLYWIALSMQQLLTFIIPAFLAEFVLSAGISVSYVPFLSVSGQAQRTTAIAIVQLSCLLIGAGLGPFIAGLLSDILHSLYGVDSLRYSLTTLVGVLLPAAAAFCWAGRTLPNDLED